MQRTFLLGAGFSKAVADGPLMKDIWHYIEKAYEKEKSRGVLGGNNRLEWYKLLNNFIKKFEEEATCGFNKKKFDELQVGIRENIEHLFTLIDLHLTGPEIQFKKKGVDIAPYRVIPWRIITKSELEERKRDLLTFLYIIFVNLEGNSLVNKFAEIINEKDEIITFNYDLVLEKALWQRNIWSPLNGYVGVVRFKNQDDEKKLKEAKKDFGLRIHKMHGSVCWVRRNFDKAVSIELDNKENWGFHFDALENILGREPLKPSGKLDRQFSNGYVGRYDDLPWILPSFIKPFEEQEFYDIWKSAIKVMSKTDALVIIGYSFRPEDSNAQLLIANLPDKCNLILVDKRPEDIKEGLEKKGLKIRETYTSLEEYLSGISRKV